MPEIYEAKPNTERPLLDRIDNATLISWFNCNSCLTCKWRKEVLDKDQNKAHDINWCSRLHERRNICDMVPYLGYATEGIEKLIYPKFQEDA